MTSTNTAVQTYQPKANELTFAQRCQVAIDAIKATMAQVEVTTIGQPYGKDSSAVLVLVLEAARQMLAETGRNPRIKLITADTLVENPLQVRLATVMSARALTFAQERGLDVEQIWVTPENIDSYLVKYVKA